jgi:hypothetical protein
VRLVVDSGLHRNQLAAVSQCERLDGSGSHRNPAIDILPSYTIWFSI